MKSSDLCERLLKLAVDCVQLESSLGGSYALRVIFKQLIRSATSAGANYAEAIGAESKADFVHKLQLVLKELRETLYWLKLILKTNSSKKPIIVGVLNETGELSKIIAKSVLTAKKNTNSISNCKF